MAIFFSAATAAGAFGGLFAYGIMKLDGERGIQAWRWIFIVSDHPVWRTRLFLRKYLVLLQS
jgi:MFS family permease